MLCIMGENPLARDEQGRCKVRIATIFPEARVLVTLPGIHATQRDAYVAELATQRGVELPVRERDKVWWSAVDLIVENGVIQIRPDPTRIPLMFAADEALQTLVSKRFIHFLNVHNKDVREAIQHRGESWRITSVPLTEAAQMKMIRDARIGIEGREIYYYNKATGTRWLTFQEFCGLEALDDDSLRRHLMEIHRHGGLYNRQGNREVDWFQVPASVVTEWANSPLAGLELENVRETYRGLKERLAKFVPEHLRADDPSNADWRNKMAEALMPRRDDMVQEASLLRLGAEFHRRIEWLPGGRIVNDELLLDPVFDEQVVPNQPGPPCDPKARAFIHNFIREYDGIEYLNVGRIVESLSTREPTAGRREVYIVEMKLRGEEREIVKIIRMQKWGVREHLDDGSSMERAVFDAEDYTEYILDRRLGCRQLGIRLPARITPRKIIETYDGKNAAYTHHRIWSPYFERDYVAGVATDKVRSVRFQDPTFAIVFAFFMGHAAAPNLIIGRSYGPGNDIVFDDGDEVLVMDQYGNPQEVVVADHTGSFANFTEELEAIAPRYANPLNKRLAHIRNLDAVIEAYLTAFIEHFRKIQRDYRQRRAAFDSLFNLRTPDTKGNFAHRWLEVLRRLDRSDPVRLAEIIRQNIRRP